MRVQRALSKNSYVRTIMAEMTVTAIFSSYSVNKVAYLRNLLLLTDIIDCNYRL